MTDPLGGSSDDELRLIDKVLPLVGLTGLMWLIEIVDRVTPGWSLQANGIHPRELDGLVGIAWSPFLHSTWGHLLANTAPLLILGALMMIRGLGRWIAVTLFVAIAGGLFTWVVGGSGNHIGASGLVFGYFGALVGAAVFERSLRAAAVALVAVMFYGSLWVGLIPREGLSWEGHLGGLLAGIMVAKLIAEPRPQPQVEPPVRGDEYWLEGTPDL